MAGVRFTDLQSRPSRPRAKSVWPHGGWMGNRGPRAGLPSTQTAPSQHQKTAFVHLGLPQNLCPSGGARALIRHGPGPSESVVHVLFPALLAARRALGDAPARSLSALAQRLGVSEAAAAPMVVPLEEEPAPVAPIPAAAQASPLVPMTGPNRAESVIKIVNVGFYAGAPRADSTVLCHG